MGHPDHAEGEVIQVLPGHIEVRQERAGGNTHQDVMYAIRDLTVIEFSGEATEISEGDAVEIEFVVHEDERIITYLWAESRD